MKHFIFLLAFALVFFGSCMHSNEDAVLSDIEAVDEQINMEIALKTAQTYNDSLTTYNETGKECSFDHKKNMDKLFHFHEGEFDKHHSKVKKHHCHKDKKPKNKIKNINNTKYQVKFDELQKEFEILKTKHKKVHP